MRRTILAAILLGGAALAITLGVIHRPFTSIDDMAHESIRFHLNLTASSIYEYHTRTGQWPTQPGDLAATSLPAVSPYWRDMLDEGCIVIVWHQTLQANPKDNADQILAYYDKGELSEQGQKWVCWGDLRTEYIKTADLQAYLDKRKK